mmetsp:Transcript_7407/g.16417  ORF Transcript_7407/g.16417 Transcript_7407/m.16417 type:complete len:407 (+) Transcript_7407:2130-3350(+)
MLHSTTHGRIEGDALLHERSHVVGIRVTNIVHIELIQRKKRHTTKFVLFQPCHELGSSGISIDNDVKQRVLSSNLNSSLILWIRQVKVLHHQSKVLNTNSKLLLHHNVLQGIQSHGSGTRHGLLHIVESLARSFTCLRHLVGQLVDGTPLLFPRVGHFVTNTFLLVHITLHVLQQLGLGLEVLPFGLGFLLLGDQGLAKTGELVTLFVQPLFLLRLGKTEFFNLGSEVNVTILLGTELLSAALFRVQSLHLLPRFVSLVRHCDHGGFGLVVCRLDSLTQLRLNLGNLFVQLLQLAFVKGHDFTPLLKLLFNILAFQIKLGPESHCSGFVLLQSLEIHLIPPQSITLRLLIRLHTHNPLMHTPSLLTQLTQPIHRLIPLMLNLIQRLTCPTQLLVIQGILHGSAITI